MFSVTTITERHPARQDAIHAVGYEEFAFKKNQQWRTGASTVKNILGFPYRRTPDLFKVYSKQYMSQSLHDYVETDAWA